MNAPEQPTTRGAPASRWGSEPSSRVPGWVYTDPEIFRAGTGTLLLSRPLVLRRPRMRDSRTRQLQAHGRRRAQRDHGARPRRATVRVVENRCAHRGVAFCRERHGTVKDFVCPYHQWNYDLEGNLIGLPFRRGVKQDGKIHGGMPAGLQAGGPRPEPPAGGVPRRRGLRQLRSGRGAVRGFRRPRGPALLRPRLRPSAAEAARLQPPAHSGQLEADAGEHQGSLPSRAAAHLVRDLRPVARRPAQPDGDGPAPSPCGDGFATQRRRRRRRHQGRHQLSRSDEAQRRPPARRGAGGLVARSDGGHDHALSQRHHPAAGQLAQHPPPAAGRPRASSTSSGPTSALPTTRPR